MSLWGASTSDESKPKHLTTAEKKNVLATSKGWVRKAGTIDSGNDNASADVEVLVAIGDLTTSLGAATVTGVEFVTTAWDASAGGTMEVRMRWNEAVTVVEAGSGLKMNLQRTPDGGSAASHTLRYASGSGTYEFVFSLAIAGGSPVAADDVFSINAQDLVKAGATTLKDTGTSVDAEIGISAAAVAAAGTITATA